MDEMRKGRRKRLKQGALILAALPLLGWQRAGAAKAPKAALHYQDRPKDGRQCADCVEFVPPVDLPEGRCRSVEGAISPHGWCMAFTRK
jgi:hypothetical protein